MSLLQADGLTLSYGSAIIVEALDITFPVGKITAIIGPNGCGKSTLLAGLARLHRPKRGSVLLDGKAIATIAPRDLAQRLALLPQDVVAPDGLTVHDLIRFGRHPHQGLLRQWSADDQRLVEEALEAADLTSIAQQPLRALSGGQRQRAWIAMAIAQDTPLLLLDEPTAALDLGHQIEVFELLRQLSHAGKTIVMVVHDLASACRYADQLIAMHAGRVVAEGHPTAVVTPDLLRLLYGIECELVLDPLTQTPIVVGVRRAPIERTAHVR